MTVALANSNPVQAPGNGTAVTYQYPWKISAATDLIVGFITAGVYSVQSAAGYTVAGIGNTGGGSITFSVAPPTGTTVDLRTATPATQPTEFANLGAYLPENTTNAMDRLTRVVQDLTRRTYTFGIHGPDSEFIPWPTLPGPVARASQNLGFDANGNLALTTGGGSVPPPVNISYAATNAEQTAGLAIVNSQFPPYTPDRYLTNGSGVDMWTAIFGADAAANIAGTNVNFLPGVVYGVNCTNHGQPLTISSSWVCNGMPATIQRLDFGTTSANYTAQALQVSHLTLSGLIFDGQVTAASSPGTPNVDIGTVGSFNDNNTESLWSQVTGVIFRQTQFCTVQNCVFKNFLRAGLRFDSSTGTGPPVASSLGAPWTFFAGGGQPQTGSLTTMISLGNRVINCRTQRTRGINGDGFYTENSENAVFVNCYVYDYQRIGYVLELGNQTNNYGTNGSQYVNCTSDYGHDAVTGILGNQSNVGFWSESCDGLSMTNCESKNTSVGWLIGSAANASQGVFRPYTGTFTLTGCRAIRCNSTGFKISMASRDAHVVLNGCYAEVNSTAATYSGSVGTGNNGYQISFLPSGTGPNPSTSCRVDLLGCRADIVGVIAYPQAVNANTVSVSAVNVLNGGVASPQQFTLNINGLSIAWLETTGAYSAADVQKACESTAGSNFGYCADILFSGANNGGTRFAGRAKISNCTNETTGYVTVSSEISGTSSVLEIENTRVSMRTGSIAGVPTSNNGTLILGDCAAVDVRGQLGWSQVFATGCTFSDLSFTSDRTQWGAGSGTEFHLTNCQITRQLLLTLPSGASGARGFGLNAVGCEWFMQFGFTGGGEPGLTIPVPTSFFSSVQLTGCAFRNVGGKGTASGSMIQNTGAGTLQVLGAGNAYDSSFVSTGGNLIQYVNTPSFNNAPQTIAAPFITVNGTLQLWASA